MSAESNGTRTGGGLRAGAVRVAAMVSDKIPGVPGASGEPGKKSRRFPAVTRDTARPEGGGRAGGGHTAAPYRQWPLLAVSGGVLIGLLVTVLEFRTGTILIGLSMIGGAVLRRMLPSVGMLAVRSRFTDMVTYAVLGVAIMMLSMMSQPDPWITIPFLNDIVHFSVR